MLVNQSGTSLIDSHGSSFKSSYSVDTAVIPLILMEPKPIEVFLTVDLHLQSAAFYLVLNM